MFKDLKKKLHTKMMLFLSYLIFELHWDWLDAILSTLCILEINLRLAHNPQLKEDLQICHVVDSTAHKPIYETKIPENTVYCEDCPYYTQSKLATLFYGEQVNGYCYFLNQGDFSFGNCTDLLWDGVKCCNINDDIDWDTQDVEYAEYFE